MTVAADGSIASGDLNCLFMVVPLFQARKIRSDHSFSPKIATYVSNEFLHMVLHNCRTGCRMALASGDARLERPQIFPQRRRNGSTLAASASAAGQPDHRRPTHRRARASARLPLFEKRQAGYALTSAGELLEHARQVETAPALRRAAAARAAMSAARPHHRRGDLRGHSARADAARPARAAPRDHDRARHGQHFRDLGAGEADIALRSTNGDLGRWPCRAPHLR